MTVPCQRCDAPGAAWGQRTGKWLCDLRATSSQKRTRSRIRDGEGDPRRVMVPVAELRNPHMAVARGGDWASLEEPSLAVYVDSSWVPVEWRSGRHGGGSMKLLVVRDGTEPEVFERLRAEGALRCHSLEFAAGRRRRSVERVAA